MTPENVGVVVQTVRPFAVDVRSGIERDGRKDRERMLAFVRAVHMVVTAGAVIARSGTCLRSVARMAPN